MKILGINVLIAYCKYGFVFALGKYYVNIGKTCNVGVIFAILFLFLCPPLKKEGHIAFHMSVGMSVGRYVSIP